MTLKQALVTILLLAFPIFEKSFVVETSASAVATETVLWQKKEAGKIHGLQYKSRKMMGTEKKHAESKRKGLAFFLALRNLCLYPL